MLAITGNPVASLTVFNASRISAISENVSSRIMSAPPSASARACSAKIGLSCSGAISRTARIFPLGPIEPVTSTSRLPIASRASSAPRRLISATPALAARRSRFNRLAANVLVVMKRAPASR